MTKAQAIALFIIFIMALSTVSYVLIM